MYVNGKLTPVKLFQDWGGREIKENGGEVNSRMIYLIYCICHNVLPPSTITNV
jgi:hypothetical protein